MVQNCPLFVNVHKYHSKCNRRGVGGQKSQNLVNVVCERPLNVSAKNGGDKTNPHVPVFSCAPDITVSSSKIGS